MRRSRGLDSALGRDHRLGPASQADRRRDGPGSPGRAARVRLRRVRLARGGDVGEERAASRLLLYQCLPSRYGHPGLLHRAHRHPHPGRGPAGRGGAARHRHGRHRAADRLRRHPYRRRRGQGARARRGRGLGRGGPAHRPRLQQAPPTGRTGATTTPPAATGRWAPRPVTVTTATPAAARSASPPRTPGSKPGSTRTGARARSRTTSRRTVSSQLRGYVVLSSKSVMLVNIVHSA
jgi:hypothetical protein